MRLRMNASAKPDYGLLLAHTDDTVATTDGSSLSIAAGRAALTLSSDATHPVGLALNWRGKPLLTSITDEHFRGMAKPLEATRIAPFGIAVGMTVAAFALASDTPVYGLGEKGGALNKRGQLVAPVLRTRWVSTPICRTRTRRLHGPLPRTVAGVCSGAHNSGRDAWRRLCAVVESQLRSGQQRVGAGPFLHCRDTPVGVLAAYHRLDRQAGERAAVVARRTGQPRLLPRRSRHHGHRERGARAPLPADVITFDGRARQDTPTRFHFNFDPSRYPDPKRAIDQLKALDYKICCWEYPLVSINHPEYGNYLQRGYFLKRSDGSELVFEWDTGKKTTPFGPTLTPLPPSGRWTSPTLRLTPGGAIRTGRCGRSGLTPSK